VPTDGGLQLDQSYGPWAGWGDWVQEALYLAIAAVVLVSAAIARFAVRGTRRLGTSTQRASYETLHTASLAAPALRTGLHPDAVERAIPHLRALLRTPGLVVTDTEGVVAADNVDGVHCQCIAAAMAGTVARGRPQMLTRRDLDCGDTMCPLQAGVVVPLLVDGRVVGALAALDETAAAGLLRLSSEVAQFVSTQLELSELDRSRQRAVRAELRFLRAQISPHFIYNALTAIESYVRTDPDRARELLVEFADFTRYAFRGHGQFTTMAEELRLVDAYLDLERARFGDRLHVTLRVSPEVLSVQLPSLVLQPLVENALRHGLEPSERPGELCITVEDADNDAVVSVEDNGAGASPGRIRRVLAGAGAGDEVGLHNVDERLRTVFGDEYGLTIETAPGAGTKVIMRLPKSHAAVQV
jgi:two-component system, LytTR family, sensor kinase